MPLNNPNIGPNIEQINNNKNLILYPLNKIKSHKQIKRIKSKQNLLLLKSKINLYHLNRSSQLNNQPVLKKKITLAKQNTIEWLRCILKNRTNMRNKLVI